MLTMLAKMDRSCHAPTRRSEVRPRHVLVPVTGAVVKADLSGMGKCSVCAGSSKQVGAEGTRILPGFALCNNCEDRAKHFKRDGIIRGTKHPAAAARCVTFAAGNGTLCQRSNQPFGEQEPCVIKHLEQN